MYPTKKLSEICELITDGSHFSPKTLDIGFPYITVKDINENGEIDLVGSKKISEKDFFELTRSNCSPKVGDILLSKDGTVGKVAIVKEEGFVILSSLAIIRPSGILNYRFLAHFLKSSNFTKVAIASKTGAAIKRIVLKTIKEFIIPLPPLSIQSRIVAKLDEAFGNIDKQIKLLRGNIEDVENMKKSALEESFQSGEYEMKILGDICNFKNGFAFKSPEFNEDSNGLQVIRIGNVLDLDKNKVFIEQSNLFNEFMLKKFDIIVGMTGTRKKRDYLLPGIITDNNTYYLNQRVGRLRVLEDTADYKFLYFFLKTDHFRNKIFAYETGTVNQGNISGKDISNQLIPLPPLPRQHEIVTHLDAVFDKTKVLRSEYEAQIRDLEIMKQSLLSDAFAGRLVQENEE